ncbi:MULTISPECIES: 3'-5' exonuclease [unclassified Bacillus (in: firmicutes)]|uniref:3'-5' exonuclease n=1 Tax=unclassified Bacillus (in: firmicutes) TaxID=185979 RepID=UPI0008E6D504|nr:MULTISPECIES: 3'-5' exonuclease [unclassified Bacillus (in: firmicutes)]SFI34360.1 DNA polymerase-3 subunit epsilon [Bacillus sp. 71mf]SFS35935.1 DNA polymerase-3 subunit epsilon [Bacillus sp. 103mf]
METFTGDYVVIDFETTGFNPYQDSIIQMAAIRYRNHICTDQFVSYVNPEKMIPSRITMLTGIRNFDVAAAPTIDIVLPEFVSFLREDTIIAHNASFDMRFLKSNMERLRLGTPKNVVLDTLSLAKRYIKHTPNHKLETLKRLLQIEVASHNALDDCFTCAAVYQKCVEIKVGEEKKKGITKEEERAYEIVKEILEKHNKDTTAIRSASVGNYLDIKAMHSFVRIKLKGRKKYVLTNKGQDEIATLYPNVICEAATKSEWGLTRMRIDGPEDIVAFEGMILEAYEEVNQILQHS